MLGGMIHLAVTGRRGSLMDSGKEHPTLRRNAHWVVLYAFVSISFYLILTTKLALVLALMLCVATVCGFLWSRAPFWPLMVLLTATIALMLYNVHRMNSLPDDPGMDLLPITRAAIHYAAKGIDPYQADYSHVTPNPFFYLPTQWMSYAPFELIGINLRWVNVVCWMAIIAVFEWVASAAINRNLARLVFYPVIVSFPVFQAMDAQVLPMWLGTTCFMATLLRGRLILAAALLGWLVTNNQMMLAVAGLSSVYFVRTQPWHQFLRCAALVTAIVLLVLGPFILFSPNFLKIVFVERPRIANMTWEIARNAYNSIGINNILYNMHIGGLRPMLQAGVLAAGAVLIFLRPPQEMSRFLFVAGVVFLFAIALNGQILRYYYYPALLMISWGFMSFPTRHAAPAVSTS